MTFYCEQLTRSVSRNDYQTVIWSKSLITELTHKKHCMGNIKKRLAVFNWLHQKYFTFYGFGADSLVSNLDGGTNSDHSYLASHESIAYSKWH